MRAVVDNTSFRKYIDSYRHTRIFIIMFFLYYFLSFRYRGGAIISTILYSFGQT